MSKVDVYIAGYLTIDEVTHEESERLASNECMIGMPLDIRYDAETGIFTLVTPTGGTIGTIRPKNRLAFREAIEDGWTRKCWLSLVYYLESDKSFHGEVVYQLYNVKSSQTDEQEALDTFAEGISQSLKAGERPSVSLTGSQYDQVISSKGSWKPDGTEKLPISTARGSGAVVFKHKRSLSDKLAQAALDRNPGCRIASIIVLLALLALIIFIVISIIK